VPAQYAIQVLRRMSSNSAFECLDTMPIDPAPGVAASRE
jgi:hypothetical protein